MNRACRLFIHYSLFLALTLLSCRW